uniref:AMP-dependent synthetase/ligase domain-containing protein n=1 Tax=Parascaris equorum TaxID=6256 RepID=A0A914RX43_PAREQ
LRRYHSEDCNSANSSITSIAGGYTPLNDPPQGEILVSGPNVSPGYWKQPEKTAEDFITINGVRYFATGDIGEMREDGSLLIIGTYCHVFSKKLLVFGRPLMKCSDRKKDLVKLQHGEYVSLAKIETALLNCPLVDNLCVYGSSLQAYVVALVVPNRKHLMKIADELGEETSDWKKLCSNEKVIAVFKRQLDEHAMKMPAVFSACFEYGIFRVRHAPSITGCHF